MVMNKNDQEMKLCRACNKIKPLNMFITIKNGERGARCRLCKANGIVIPKAEKLTISSKVKNDIRLRLKSITKKDYIDTYEFLRDSLGYDLNSEFTIHEQFCIKYNLTPHSPEQEFDNHFSIKDCGLS